MTSGDVSQETDDNQSSFLYLDIEVMQSYTLLKITNFDFKLQGYNQVQICKHTMYRKHGSTMSNPEHCSAPLTDTEIHSYMPESACRVQSRFRSQRSLTDSKLHSNIANATHQEAVRDYGLVELQSLQREMAVPESQQPLPQMIIAPEV